MKWPNVVKWSNGKGNAKTVPQLPMAEIVAGVNLSCRATSELLKR